MKKKLTTTTGFAAAAMLALTALAGPAVAHHVGDKDIPGQDYQMEDDWLTDRAHMNAPWDYIPVDVNGDPIVDEETGEPAETGTTTNNVREEHLADCEEFDPKPNENSGSHDVGEQFVHEAWQAVTGRNVLDEDFGSPNSTGNGQVVSSQPETAQDNAALSGGETAVATRAGKD